MPNRILRLRTVLDRTGLSRTTMYRKIGEGTFPQQLRISVHGAGWSEAEVDRWSPIPLAIAPTSIGADQKAERRRSGTTLSRPVLSRSPPARRLAGPGAVGRITAIAVEVACTAYLEGGVCG